MLLKLHFPNIVFKENDNFQRGFLKSEDKPENGGGQNKNDACLREEKLLPDIVLAPSLKLTPRTYSLSIIHEARIHLLLAACLDPARALSVVKCVWEPPSLLSPFSTHRLSLNQSLFRPEFIFPVTNLSWQMMSHKRRE